MKVADGQQIHARNLSNREAIGVAHSCAGALLDVLRQSKAKRSEASVVGRSAAMSEQRGSRIKRKVLS